MDSFTSLMEFAVAIAGFSGITMAVQARSADHSEIQVFRNAMLILFSLSAAFTAAIPQVFAHFGASGPEIWTRSSLAYAPICFATLLAPFFARRSIAPENRGQLSPIIWVLTIGGVAVIFVAQIANAFGLLGTPGPAPIYSGILWMIALSALMYARMVLRARSLTVDQSENDSDSDSV